MKSIFLLFIFAFSSLVYANSDFYQTFKDLQIENIKRDVKLENKVLSIQMNTEKVTRMLAESVVLSNICIDVSLNTKKWKKYPFEQVIIYKHSGWGQYGYIANIGIKECLDAWGKGGIEKYKTEEYFKEYKN